MLKKLSFWNTLSRILFLLRNPGFFASYMSKLLLRQIPEMEIEQCKLCKRCEQVCLVNIPLTDYVEHKNSLTTELKVNW